MSTTYYGLKPPVTSLRLESCGRHSRVIVWVAHGFAGSLMVSEAEARELVMVFADTDGNPAVLTHLDGGEVVVSVFGSLGDDACVVSEYGEVLTVRAIKACAAGERCPCCRSPVEYKPVDVGDICYSCEEKV